MSPLFSIQHYKHSVNMADYKGDAPPNQGHALVIDFMERNLPAYHPYFQHPPVRVDERTGRYVDVHPLGRSRAVSSGHDVMDASAIADRETKLTIIAPDSGPGMKPEESVLKAMTFWNLIFPLAMEKFKNMTLLEAPKHLDPAYDIRNDRTWTEVSDKLEKARDHYTDETGISGSFRRARR